MLFAVIFLYLAISAPVDTATISTSQDAAILQLYGAQHLGIHQSIAVV